MPLVFVHGVNVRDDAYRKPSHVSSAYRRQEGLRNRMFTEHLYGRYAHNPLGIDNPVILNPYWGHMGVSFKFNHASLPASHEILGDEQEALADEISGRISALHLNLEGLDERRQLLAVASKSPSDFVDLIFLAASSESWSEDDQKRLAELSVLAARLSPAELAEQLKKCANESELETAIRDSLRQVEQSLRSQKAHENLGFSDDPIGTLGKLFKGFALAAPKALGRVTGAVARKPGNRLVATALGDVIQYIKERGDKDRPGLIATEVLTKLIAASKTRSATDPLVVVAHSMGGNIVYDIVTHFAPDPNQLTIDVLVTVGSQVGLFEEASFFRASQPVASSEVKVPKPTNVTRWLNVFDPNDFLGYSVAKIFEGVDQEWPFSTGWGLALSHTKYFVTPKLFSRIADFVSGVNA